MDKQESQKWTNTFLFLTWLSAGKCLLSGGEKRGFIYPRYPSEFGGHGLLLSFWNSLREDFSILFDRPVGKTAASIPRGSTKTSGM